MKTFEDLFIIHHLAVAMKNLLTYGNRIVEPPRSSFVVYSTATRINY